MTLTDKVATPLITEGESGKLRRGRESRAGRRSRRPIIDRRLREDADYGRENSNADLRRRTLLLQGGRLWPVAARTRTCRRREECETKHQRNGQPGDQDDCHAISASIPRAPLTSGPESAYAITTESALPSILCLE